MRDVNSKGVSYFGQFGTLMGLTGGGLIIGTLLVWVVWLMMTGHSVPTNADEMLQPKYYNEIMVVQVIQTFFMFFIPVWLFSVICYHNPGKFMGFNLRFNYKQVLIVIGILAFTFPLSASLGELNKIIPIPVKWSTYFKLQETSREAQESALIQLNSFPKYILSLVVIAFLPALFEETYFRAGLQNIFTRWFKGPWVAIIVTSIIFSAIHLSYYGFLVRFALGMLLGIIYYYGGSLWLNVLLHFLFNGVQLTALYIYNHSHPAVNAKDIDPGFSCWWGVISLVIITWLVLRFTKLSRLQLAKYPAEEVPKDDFENWVGNL